MPIDSFHQTVTQSGALTHDGTVLLHFAFRFPSEAIDRNLSEFFRAAAKREEDGMKNHLFPALIARYEQDSDRRKRYRYSPFSFTSEASLLHKSESLLSVRSEVRLMRGRDVLFAHVRGTVWRRKDGCLLSPPPLPQADTFCETGGQGSCLLSGGRRGRF